MNFDFSKQKGRIFPVKEKTETSIYRYDEILYLECSGNLVFLYHTQNSSPISYTSSLISNETILGDSDRNTVKDFYIYLSQISNLHFYSPYPKNRHQECAVRSTNTFTIGPKGEIYTCWENIGKDSKIIGNLKDGKIQINDKGKYVQYLFGADFLDDKICQDCLLFPICNGGCPEKRIRNHFENASFDCCCIQKENIEDILDNHYSLKYKVKNMSI